jgi:hypothetical protein
MIKTLAQDQGKHHQPLQSRWAHGPTPRNNLRGYSFFIYYYLLLFIYLYFLFANFK